MEGWGDVGEERVGLHGGEHAAEAGFLLRFAEEHGVVDEALIDARVHARGVSVAEPDGEGVGHHVLWVSLGSFCNDGNLLNEVDAEFAAHDVSNVGEVVEHHHGISGTFGPDACGGIIAVGGKLGYAPLAYGRVMEHTVDVVPASFAVGICLVGLQQQGHFQDVARLHEVPVVVGHAVGLDHICPFLESGVVDGAFAGEVLFQIRP